MAIKDQAINLVLRARNLLSGGTDAAAKSVEELADSAEGLRGKLRSLEDQGQLIRQFQRAEKAVDKTRTAWQRAELRVEKLREKMERSGNASRAQARELELAEEAARKAGAGYKRAEQSLEELGKEAEAAGVDLSDLNKAQRANADESRKAKRAIADYNREVAEGDSRIKGFAKSLGRGALTFAKWAAAAGAAGAALTVTAVTRFTASQADLARQTLASAEAFGVSTEELQKWQFASRQVGIEGDKTADILKDVAEKIGDAYLTGGGEAREVIQGLGLDLERLAQMRPDEQILAIAQEIEGLPQAGQVQILEALASDASLLLPLLANNAEKLREFGQIAQERGAILSEEELRQLAEANKAFEELRARLDGFAKRVATRLAPAFEEIADRIDKALGDKPELIDQIGERVGALATSIAEWAASVVESSDVIGDRLRRIGDGAEGVRQLFIAAYRGVQSFGAGAAEVAARVVYDWNRAGLAILELRNKIGLASDEAVESARFAVENAATSVADLKAQSEQYQDQMIAAGKAAVDAFASAGRSALEAAGDTEQAAGAAGRLGDELEAAAGKAGKSGEAFRDFAAEQASLEAQIAATADALEAAGEALLENDTEENRQQVARLRAEYERLFEALRDVKNEALSDGVNGSDAPSTAKKQAEDYRKLADSVGEVADETGKVWNQFVVLGQETDKVGESVEETGRQAESSAASVGAAIGNIVNGWATRLTSLSQRAGQAFSEAIGGPAVGAASELENRLEFVNYQISEMRGRLQRGGSIGGLIRDMAEAGLETERSFLEQSIAVDKLTESILRGDRSAVQLNMTAEQIRQQFDLLDDNSLRPLIGAIQSARREVEGLNESLLDTIASTRQELAALEGDTAELERLRYEERRIELQEQLNLARQTGDREAIANAEEALRLTEKAFRLRTQQAEARAAEERARAAELEARAADERLRDEREERQDLSRTERRTQAQTNQVDAAASSSRVVRIEVAAGGRPAGVLTALDDGSVDGFLDSLEQAGLLANRG